MTDHALASFEAKDGTGRWEVFTWGIIANGQRYHFTKQSHIVCAGLPGRTEKHVYQTEEDDGFGLWAALAVYQETGSLADAGLAAWLAPYRIRSYSASEPLPCHGAQRPCERNPPLEQGLSWCKTLFRNPSRENDSQSSAHWPFELKHGIAA